MLYLGNIAKTRWLNIASLLLLQLTANHQVLRIWLYSDEVYVACHCQETLAPGACVLIIFPAKFSYQENQTF
jgi:hypothetical protein